MEPEQIVELTELDRRRSNGLLITLWWVKGTMETYVEVVDLKEQPPTVLEIPVQRGVNPHDVFTHPYGHLNDVPLELSE